MNPHDHEWRMQGGGGGIIRTCILCGEVQRRILSVTGQDDYRIERKGEMPFESSGYPTAERGGPSPRPQDWPETYVSERSKERLSDHGGFGRYDPARGVIIARDGNAFSIPKLAKLNGTTVTEIFEAMKKLGLAAESVKESLDPFKASLAEIRESMKGLPGYKGVSETDEYVTMTYTTEAEPDWVAGSKTGPERNLVSMTDEALEAYVQDRISKIGLQTTDDAVTLIIETIKHDADPFKAGGEWMVKMTNAITEAIRDEEDEDAG